MHLSACGIKSCGLYQGHYACALADTPYYSDGELTKVSWDQTSRLDVEVDFSHKQVDGCASPVLSSRNS